jgi:exonuclease SbcD
MTDRHIGRMPLRVLHTADWHLGDRLGGIDRLPDQLARLEELTAHAESEQADVLLVCGDVLEESRPRRLAPIVAEVASLLEPSVERGMQCVFLRGNHDSRHTFDLLASLQRLIGGGAGQVRFVGSPALVPLKRAGAEEAAATLVALPYPTAPAYGVDAQAPSLEAKQAALQVAVGEHMERLTAEARGALPGLPTLMAGHFLLSGAPAATGAREVSEDEDVRIESGRLGDFAYVALGHVHEPAALAENVRYSGALDRVDFGESGQDRHAVLVEIADDGRTTQRELALDATPMVELEIGSLGEIAEQAETLPERERTIVKLVMRLGRDDSAALWMAEARARFPRLFQPPTLIQLDDPFPSLVTGEIERADVGETVRDYLAGELEDDPDRDELLALARELLAEQAVESR